MPLLDQKLSGQEVLNGYAQITSNFVYSTDNTTTDVTGVTITFTPLQAAVMIQAGGNNVIQSTTASAPTVSITDSSNNIVAAATESLITGALNFSFQAIQARLTLTPGTAVTYKLRVVRGLAGASTVTLNATAQQPIWIQAVYL